MTGTDCYACGMRLNEYHCTSCDYLPTCTSSGNLPKCYPCNVQLRALLATTGPALLSSAATKVAAHCILSQPLHIDMVSPPCPLRRGLTAAPASASLSAPRLTPRPPPDAAPGVPPPGRAAAPPAPPPPAAAAVAVAPPPPPRVVASAAVRVSSAPLSRPAAAALRWRWGAVGVRLPAGPASACSASRQAGRWACVWERDGKGAGGEKWSSYEWLLRWPECAHGL
jgi:hypothetical protein